MLYNWQHRIIQGACFNFLGTVLIHLNRSFYGLINTLLVKYRHKDNWHICIRLTLFFNILFKIIRALIVFFY